MSVEPVNTVPYAVAMQEMDEVYEQYENDLLQKYGEDGWDEFTSGLNRETSEFFAAERAAREDLETLKVEEEKELDENDRIRGLQVRIDLWDKLVGPYFNALQKITSSGGSYDKNNPTYKKMVKGHAKWKKETDKMEDDFFRIQREIMGKYREQREPIENIAYEQLMGLREPVEDSPYGQARYKIVNRDGDESSGADYTALDGTVYKGQNTYFDEYYNGEENFYNQMSALYDPVADLQKYVDGAFVREGIGERFESDFGFSSENWSPAKSGDGKPRGGKPKPKPDPRASFAGTGADAATFSFDGSTNKKKKQNEEVLLKYARPIPEKKELFERVKSKGFFNQNDIKPEFPENPPPKLDPKTGMHPQYGKKANRYKKLDPHSANSMPLTGDPETDEVVRKQKTINKIKKMAKKNLKESDFTNITTGNKVGQTFQHTSGATITLDGALGGKMMVPSQVTLDLGFGEKITVDGPTESDFGFTGFTKPLDLKVQKRIAGQSKDEINDKLDASEKASGAETAKVEGEGDIWTWTEYMNQMNDLSDKYAKMAEPLEKIKLDYINKNEDVPIGIVDKIDAITKALHQAQEALHQKWLAYNKVPDLPPVSGEGEEELSTEDDEKFLEKQQTLVNLTKFLNHFGLPNDFAQWTINYAKGDMTPITKFSPGMERQIRNLVLDKFKKNPNAKTVSIQYDDYGYGFKALPTRLGLGRFNATKLDNGQIRIQDTFNVDKDFTNIGSASIVPGLQNTADRLVDISYKNRNIKGKIDKGGITIDVLIDSGLVKKKKKKVNESNVFSKIKKIRNK